AYTLAHRWPLFTFVSLYFLLFAGASCFYSLKHRESTAPEDLLLLFADAFVYALAGYAILQGVTGDYPGTFPLALAFFFGLLAVSVQALAPENVTLRRSAGGIALLFLTIMIPIQLKQGWIAIGWSIEAAVLLSLGLRFGSPLLHRVGQAVWLLSLLRLLGVMAEAHPAPQILFFNTRALPLLISALATGWMAVAAGRRAHSTEDEDAPTIHDELAALYAVYAVLAGAWLLAQETYLGLSWRHFPSPQTWQAGALFIIACVLSIYAIGVFTFGRRLRLIAFRFSALTVAALATSLPLWASVALPTTEWLPFWNLRWLAYLVVALALGALGWMTTQERDQIEPAEAEALSILPGFTSLFVLWGMTLEIYASFARWAIPSPDTWLAAAFFAIAVLWSVFAFIMLLLSLAWEQHHLRVCACVLGLLGCGVLLITALTSLAVDWTPLVNLRCLAFAIVAAMLALAALTLNRREPDLSPGETALPCSAGLMASVVFLWGLTQEIYLSFRHWSIPSPETWQSAACFALAMLWSGFALAAFIYGLKRRQEPWRYLSYLTGSMAIIGLLGTAFALQPGWPPLLNWRGFAFAVVTVALSAAGTTARRHETDLTFAESGVVGGTTLLAALVSLWGLTQETYELSRYYRSDLGEHWQLSAGFAIAILWCVFALGLLIFKTTWRQNATRTVAYWIGGLGIALLLFTALSATHLDWQPVFNPRFVAFAVAIATLMIAALILQQREADLSSAEAELPGGMALLAAGLLLWGLTQETHETCHYYRAYLGAHWPRWAQMSISLVWTLYGALLLIAGIIRGYQPVRLIALGLLGFTVMKVFVFDLSFLDGPLRILSFGGLGLALIFISYLYSRFGVGRDHFVGHTTA
ncbi:MAG: DUF2339 domain-containing protein, partial [Armatimonadota bacterium]|nr:DUF2339 domain-containing protein [Armatimonadota bacterium]